jgi:hypothetical protein
VSQHLTFDPQDAAANERFENPYSEIRLDDTCRYKIRGRQKRKARAGGPLSDFQSLIVLAMDLTQSLRGPTSISRPFSHKRGWILHGSVPSFRPCPG